MDNFSQAKNIELLETTISQLQTLLTQIQTNPEEKLINVGELENLYKYSQTLTKGSPSKPKPLIIDREEQPQPTQSQPKQKSWLPIVLGSITAILIIAISVWLLKLNSPSPVTEITETTETNETTEIVETPIPQIITPLKPQPVIIPTQPSPQLEIIPEQGLIAAIQTEVGEITDKFTENLINLVEADFLKSLLIIQVTEDWYQLTPTQQQEMANQILSRSQVLNFRKLEIRDNQGVALARNPVVGKSMVMIQKEEL